VHTSLVNSSVHTSFSGLCTRFPRCVQDLCTGFPDIPDVARFSRYFLDLLESFGLCTHFSSVHSHILVCTLVFLDCAQVFQCSSTVEGFRMSHLLEVFLDILRLVRGFLDCAHIFLVCTVIF